jgi:hypothetical protein
MSGLSKMSNTAEIIASELSLSDQLDDLDPKLLKVIKLTTSHLASKRPTAREVLLILNEDYKSIIENKFNIFDFYDNFNFITYPDLTHLIKGIPNSHLFLLWKLSGGDLDSELEKSNFVDKEPPITRIELVLDLNQTKTSNHKECDFFNKKVRLKYSISF